MTRTRRSDCSTPGIRRVRRGRGFSYHWPDGTRLDDPDFLDRIRALAIPPAWKDVWICPWPNGHIQAVGTDDAGRRQYLYHEAWRRRQDTEKFARVRDFGRALPRLRRTVRRDLRRTDLGRRRVLAAAVRMLDVGSFRIGGEEYAEAHDTYGVATLQKDHVRVRDGRLVFDFDGKGSKRHRVEIDDHLLAPVVTALKRRRGPGRELLAWNDGDGWVDVRSADVNSYIKEATGQEFSAKDFRTWSATVGAAVGLARQELAGSTRSKKSVASVIGEVAEAIGDTAAVCRRSYVDPIVVDRYHDGVTIRDVVGAAGRKSETERVRAAVLDLLDGDS